MKFPLWLAVSLITLSGSFVCGEETPDGTLKSAYENLKKAVGANGKGSSHTGFNGANAVPAHAALDFCAAEIPSDLPLSKDDLTHQRNWQPLNHPVLTDGRAHVWRAALYGLSARGQAPVSYMGFICIQNVWLESGESPWNDKGLLPDSVRLSNDGKNAYFVLHHPSNNFDVFYGVSRESLSRAKIRLESAAWVRAYTTFANMMVVDYPRGTDPNSPRVLEALDELENVGLMGDLAFKNIELRKRLAKAISQKLRDDNGKAEDRDVHIYRTFDNTPADYAVAAINHPNTMRPGLGITFKEIKEFQSFEVEVSSAGFRH